MPSRHLRRFDVRLCVFETYVRAAAHSFIQECSVTVVFLLKRHRSGHVTGLYSACALRDVREW